MSGKHGVHPLRVGFWSLLLGAALIVLPFKRVVIDGNSMFPTLKNGETYLVDRLYWRITGLQRDDIVVFREGKDEYDIVVRLAEPYREDLDALQDLTVVAEGRQIPLPSVATWRVEEGLGTVRRKDLDKVATISSDVRAGEQSNAVLREVQATLAPFAETLPPGYTMRYTGQQEDQQEAMEFLTGAFLVALMLIALILMSQFNSLLKPLITGGRVVRDLPPPRTLREYVMEQMARIDITAERERGLRGDY